MTMVTLKGEFTINGKKVDGMDVDTNQAVRFNDASGLLAVVASDKNGKVVKGLGFADDQTLQQLVSIGRNAKKDINLRVPEGF
jgi:hypothetical protein